MKNGWIRYENKISRGTSDSVVLSKHGGMSLSDAAARTARLAPGDNVEYFLNEEARLIGVRKSKESSLSYKVTHGGGKNTGLRLTIKGLASRMGLTVPKGNSVKLPLSWDEDQEMAIIDLSSVWPREPRRVMREKVHKRVARQIEEKVGVGWLDEIPEVNTEGAGR